jgi:hypothetical protein
MVGHPTIRISSHGRLPTIAENTTMHHGTQLFSTEMGSYELFCPGWPGTLILPISASQVARVADVSYWCQLQMFLFKG